MAKFSYMLITFLSVNGMVWSFDPYSPFHAVIFYDNGQLFLNSTPPREYVSDGI